MLIAGGGPTHHLGKSMQELTQHGFEDVVNVFRPVVKKAWFQVRPDTIIDTLNQAYKVATERPARARSSSSSRSTSCCAEVEGEVTAPRAVTSRLRADDESIDSVVELLSEAERPLVIAGGGVAQSPGGSAALQALGGADSTSRSSTTLTAKGVISEEHPLSLGPVGRSGTRRPPRLRARPICCSLSVRGSPTTTRATGERARSTTSRRRRSSRSTSTSRRSAAPTRSTVGILADAETVLSDLRAAVAGRPTSQPLGVWVASEADRTQKRVGDEIAPLCQRRRRPMHPARLMHEVGEAIAESGRVFIDIGDSISYAEAYMTIRRPGSWFIMPGFAEMGSASSGVLGAAVADPTQPAIAVTGDGAFNMISQHRRRGGRVRPAGDLGDRQQRRARDRAQGDGPDLQAHASRGCVRPQGHGRALQPRLRASWPRRTAPRANGSRRAEDLGPALGAGDREPPPVRARRPRATPSRRPTSRGASSAPTRTSGARPTSSTATCASWR